jgi:hypothetical protein
MSFNLMPYLTGLIKLDRVGFEPTTSAAHQQLSLGSVLYYLLSKGAAAMEREGLYAQILPNLLRNART